MLIKKYCKINCQDNIPNKYTEQNININLNVYLK